MSRKLKYSKELKLEIIDKYINGESTIKLAKKYGMTSSGNNLIKNWYDRFVIEGERAFDHKPTNKAYTVKFKMNAIEEYLSGRYSLNQICNNYKISRNSVLSGWIKKYNNGIELKNYDPKPEVYMAKSRKVNLEEKIEIVNFCIQNNFDYKITAIKYDIAYFQVFNWVKKYKTDGENGLIDNRGNRKAIDTLTDVDKLKLENQKLTNELKYKQMEIDALKKLKELEGRFENKARKK
ncbi:MAG: transposase [Anaeroplasmataceae bacterium]